LQAELDNMVIALAGIAQAIHSIEAIAKTGKTDEKSFETSINSLFQTNPAHAVDVFGNIDHLKQGLQKLLITLNTKSPESYLTIKHVLSIMNIQKKISQSPIAMKTLIDRLHQTKKQVDYFSLSHPTVIANLADIYITVITPFRFRFYLSGSQQTLSIRENMHKIRALLLAAIRASVLWRQMGGSRLQLVFSREKIKTSARSLLYNLSQ
jgi:high frequency lysogenization protein